MNADDLAGHLAAGRFHDAATLITSYTVPRTTERQTDFIVHDLAADVGEIIAGTFEPIGPRVMIDIESAFSIVGTSRGELFLYTGQPDTPGERLFDCGGKPLPGVELHSAGALCGDLPWASTTARRIVIEVDPTKTVTWQILAGILGPSAVTPVPSPAQIAVTPDGQRAFVTSPARGLVTPIELGRPLYSYDGNKRPDDVGEPAVATGAGATHVAADNVHAVVTNVDDAGGSVSILDAAAPAVIHHIPLSGALGVAITPEGTHAVVGTSSGELALIDVREATVTMVPLPGIGRYRAVTVTLDGRAAFAADSDGGVVHRIRLADLAVEATIDVGERPWVLRTAPDGQVWVLGRNEGRNGRLRRVNPATNTVEDDFELPHRRPNDMWIVPVAGQTDEIVRTAWTVSDEGYSEFYIGGEFVGQAHTWHTGAFPGDAAGPTGVAVNDYGEIWVVRPSAEHVFKWPGGRFSIRPGVFYGEYCTLAVYGARP